MKLYRHEDSLGNFFYGSHDDLTGNFGTHTFEELIVFPMDSVKEALATVWSQIAPDADTDDPTEQAELLIDADRLAMHGYPAENAALKLISYDEAMALAKSVI